MENNTEKKTVMVNEKKTSDNTKSMHNLLIEGIAYQVEYEEFSCNDEVRFYVCVNAGPKNVFAWDKIVKQFRAGDDRVEVIPIAVDNAISELLFNHKLN